MASLLRSFILAASVLPTLADAAVAQAPSVPDAIYYEPPGMEAAVVTRDVTYRTVSLNGRPHAFALDVYRPPNLPGSSRLPALIFVHGGLTLQQPKTAKDWGIYQSWGRVAAASGLVGVTFNHRLTTNDNVTDGADDLQALIATVRANAAPWNIDPDRV